jgi:hypothetical protein
VANELAGRRIAFLTANEGIEQVELTEPWRAVQEAGGTPELLAPEPSRVHPSHWIRTMRTRWRPPRRCAPRPGSGPRAHEGS